MTGKQALEYRDPMQVEYVDTQFGRAIKCPKCPKIFIPDKDTKFCPYCGQALSFEEESEC